MKAIEWLDDFIRYTPFGQFVKVLLYTAMTCGCLLTLIGYLRSSVPQFAIGEFMVAPVVYMLGVRGDRAFWIWLILIGRWYLGVPFGVLSAVTALGFVLVLMGFGENSPHEYPQSVVLPIANGLSMPFYLNLALVMAIITGISGALAFFLIPTSPSQRENPHKRFWGN